MLLISRVELVEVGRVRKLPIVACCGVRGCA